VTGGFRLFRRRKGAPGPTTQESGGPVLQPSPKAQDPPPTFDDVYDAHFAFVWRNVLNRGIPSAAVDDVVQEVFVVVHRKLAEFEGRASLRTWLSVIVRRVVADHVRKRGNAPAGEPLVGDRASLAPGPGEALEQKAAVALLDELLASMPENQREVFLLHEIEELTGREIAEAVGANENTVFTRLRAARRIFNEGLARLRAEETGGTRWTKTSTT
jgi:RNA polymerase sigma-70 factor, ECF subfamily